ncbi:MAG: hypothetical protein H8E66_14970 [Planctomycetes bacterium]|nr:hypothetical protein [Planctomycetota bacterium]
MGYLYTQGAARIVAEPCEYKHRFGGEPIHCIENRSDTEFVLHSLYILDTTDLAVPRVLPGRKWLPLYYPMFNDGAEIAYQVVADDSIVVHRVYGDLFTDLWEDYQWPSNRLPEHRIGVRPLSYDDQKTLVYGFTAAEHLNDDSISKGDKEYLRRCGYPFTQVGGIQRMMQSVPEQTCANVECKNCDYSNQHTVFAVVWNDPVPGFKLWGEYGGYTQIIFQMCPICQTIQVCSRCD